MAVQIESQGQLAEFLEILSRRRWQLALPALLVLTFGAALAVFIPKKFLVATMIEVRPVSASLTGKEAENSPNQIRAQERIRKLLEQLKNENYLLRSPLEQNQFVVDTRDDVKVRVDKPQGASSSFVTIEYTNVNVKWAMEFLKALRDDWKKDVIDADKNKVEAEVAHLNEHVGQLEHALKQEQDELTGLQQRNKISFTQPIPGGRETRAEDPDFDRLQRAKDLLAKVTLDLGPAEVKVKALEQRLSDTPEQLNEQQRLEGISHAAEFVDIEKQLVDLNAELARFRPQHPKYRQILEEIDKLEQKRDAIRKLTTSGELSSVFTPNPLYAQVRAELERARTERDGMAATKKQLEQSIAQDGQNVEQLYLVYNEIIGRIGNAERLSKELELATLKRDEKSLQALALSSRLNDPFNILQEVQEPLHPTEPNPWLIVAFALVAGLALGLALALTSEYGRNCFRSVHDISRVMVAPVLGSIGSILTSRQRRLRSLRRGLIGWTSAIVICSVGFVTWAWARNPELLSPQLRARLQHMCDKLR